MRHPFSAFPVEAEHFTIVRQAVLKLDSANQVQHHEFFVCLDTAKGIIIFWCLPKLFV